MTPGDPKPQGGAWVSETRAHRAALSAVSWDAESAWRKLRGYCSDNALDGVLPKKKLLAAFERKLNLKRAEAAVAELIEEGLLTDDGDTYVLDWSDQPTAEIWADPVKRERWARDKALKRDGELCRRIKDRDRHLCRYCGIRVDWNIKTLTRKVTHGGSYDHVDPDGTNSLENVVVACRLCNSRKKDRTVEQWIADDPAHGRTLKKPGTTAAQAEEVDAQRRADDPPPTSRGPATGQPGANRGPAPPLRARARPDTANPRPTTGQPPTVLHPVGFSRVLRPEDDEYVPPHDDHHYTGEAS